ncbi:MAG: DNA mismatch repair endonuclease MutL [Alphaproteobacteria bacterium]|nr:DNA mismatch repair endonuclease MutL [Alphaproteobacteria bacterium]
MSVRILPDFLVNQIAAGEVVENPASVVKELMENALDAGADQIVVDVVDGGRTSITVVDNGRGMNRADLEKSIMRHATSKLPDDDLTNITYMGFRGEALPSIASVSDVTIDTYHAGEPNGWQLNATTGEIKPSNWDSGTRIRVQNLFAKVPARLKFLRGDRAEVMSVLEIVKRLAMARRDVGFVLNNKWFFPKNQDLLERMAAVMGDDILGRMLEINADSGSTELSIHGFISEPTLRRASSVDQFLFVNGRPVKDKVIVGALRAAYMDVMHAREFPLCALFLGLNPHNVDVNVSPAKTEVHFLEPAHVRAFIIKTLRARLAETMNEHVSVSQNMVDAPVPHQMNLSAGIRNCDDIKNFNNSSVMRVCDSGGDYNKKVFDNRASCPDFVINNQEEPATRVDVFDDMPLGRAIGQIGDKYILAEKENNLIIVDQHAAHERITYERVRTHAIKVQPLLTPIVVNMRIEDVNAIMTVVDELKLSGVVLDAFGDTAIAIFEKPADWDLDWAHLLHEIADEVRANGHSVQLNEKLHLKLANWACHHSLRAGQKLDLNQMNALLRDIENTTRGGQCNHGRPVYKVIPIADLDVIFERS